LAKSFYIFKNFPKLLSNKFWDFLNSLEGGNDTDGGGDEGDRNDTQERCGDDCSHIISGGKINETLYESTNTAKTKITHLKFIKLFKVFEHPSKIFY
jgi:hypothetical protein